MPNGEKKFGKPVYYTPYESIPTQKGGAKQFSSLIEQQKNAFKAAMDKAKKESREMVCFSQEELDEPEQYIQYCDKASVEKKYKDGVKMVKKRAGLVASAISQHVIITVKMESPVTYRGSAPKAAKCHSYSYKPELTRATEEV